MIGGMVASPTPMVPMSGDSMTVMTQPDPGQGTRQDAGRHPAGGAAADDGDTPDALFSRRINLHGVRHVTWLGRARDAVGAATPQYCSVASPGHPRA